MTATELGEFFQKSAKEINQILAEIGFINKTKDGWALTSFGQAQGGIQSNFKGRLYITWDEKIKENKLLQNIINPKIDKEEENFREKFKANYRTRSGHFVRSRAEMIIADYLYSECICFAYEKMVPISDDLYCDFYLPKYDIYIEFWGLEDANYEKRKLKKQELYKQNNLKLIEIDNKIMENLDDFLLKEILKFKKI